MPEDDEKALRNAITQRISQLGPTLEDNATGVRAKQVVEVRRLHELLVALQGAAATPRRHPWLLLGPIGFAPLLIGILLIARVGDTEVTLDLTVSELAFSLSEKQAFSRQVLVPELSVTGIDRALPPAGMDPVIGNVDLSVEPISRLGLKVEGDPSAKPPMTLSRVIAPAGSRVEIKPDRAAEKLQLELSALEEDLFLDVTLATDTELRFPGADPTPAVVLIGRQRPLEIRANAHADVSFQLPLSVGQNLFQDALLVADVSLLRLIREDDLPFRTLSTVVNGTIVFESIGGKTYKLRPGEFLKLGFEEGSLVALRVAPEHITFRLNAVVTELRAGSQRSPVARDLMPRTLEWLQGQHELTLFVGGVTYLVVLFSAVARWWRPP